MEKLEFDLLIKNNSLSAALDEASKKAGGLGGALETALGVFGGGLALKGLQLLGDGIGEVVDFAKESIHAFSEQEDALNRLGQALRASGEYSDHAMDDFNNFAAALQKTSIYGDEVIINQLALAKSFGATNKEAKALVQAAVNLSATFGGDIETNMEKLGKTVNGTLGKLAQFIPELKNLTKEQLAAGGAADVINKKFSGAGASQLNTYTGSVTAMNNAFSDMQEEIGRILSKNSVMVTFLSGMKSGFEAAGHAIKLTADAMGIGLTPIQQQQEKIRELGAEYNELYLNMKNARIQMETNAKYGGDRSGEAKTVAMLAQGEIRLNQILQERVALRTKLNDDLEASKAPPKPKELPQDVIDSRAKLNAELVNLEKQRYVEEYTIAEEAQNAKIENETTRNTAEFQRILDYNLAKAELEAELKTAQLSTMQEGLDKELELKKIAQEKELAQLKARGDFQKKTDDANIKNAEKTKKDALAIEQAKQTALAGLISAGANLATAIFKDGSKEQLAAQKAAAIAQAWISTETAMANALALPLPPPEPEALAAKYKIMGAINIAAIAATAIKGFATGGIIGNGGGATMGGDNTTIHAREGEMMLNGDQQKVLFDAINSGGMGGDILIQIDGETIFRAVRNQIRKGYKLS